MAKKPIRVFKTAEPRAPQKTVRRGIRVYQDATDTDRVSITQQVMTKDLPKKRSNPSKYEGLLHAIYDAVLITDQNGKIFEANSRSEHHFQFSIETLCSMNVTNLIAGGDQRLLDVLVQNVSELRYTLLEAICVRADKTRFNAEIVVNRINITSADNFCFFIRDVTERKESESLLREVNDKLVEAERLQARMDTITTLFHELNNPMQIMTCMAEIDNNPEYKNQLARIMSTLEQLRAEHALEPVIGQDGSSRYAIKDTSALTEADPARLLVADDEELLRKMFISTIQSAFPYLTIDAAANGTEAVELFSQHHHSVIIMDVAMPNMNGEEAFETIKQICEEKKWQIPKTIFCTGFVISPTIQEIIGDGSVHSCIRKPLSMSDLVGAVQERLSTTTH